MCPEGTSLLQTPPTCLPELNMCFNSAEKSPFEKVSEDRLDLSALPMIFTWQDQIYQNRVVGIPRVLLEKGAPAHSLGPTPVPFMWVMKPP